jgi:YHS domain-containing protein
MIRSFTLWILAALMGAASAAEPVSTHWLTGAIIGGKDAVSYYESANKKAHKEVEGSTTFTVQHLGHAWRFASQASADRFAANPSAYVPQYNGFCSNALASDEGLINTNGEVWEFFGNKLHLFYAERGRQRWLNGDWQAYKKIADKAWAGLTKQAN